MNRCKPEKVGTKEDRKMLKRIQFFEEGKSLLRKREIGKLKDKKRTTRKKYSRLWNEFETGGFMAQKRAMECGRRKMLEDRGALPKEDGDQLRKYKAMHEDNFLDSWPRENVQGGKAEMKEWKEEAEQEESKSAKERWRERRGENCDQEVRVSAVSSFVLVVLNVLVSPSMVSVLCEHVFLFLIVSLWNRSPFFSLCGVDQR